MWSLQEESIWKIAIIFSLQENLHKMPTTAEAIKYENFFPEKVYHCPCLKNAADEIFNNEICSYTEMILAASECCVGDSQVFCMSVEEKTNCLFLCQPHLLITMMSEAKIDCSWACEKVIVFNALHKRYCRGCVRHYCQKLCDIYQFKFFNSSNL